MFDKVNKLSSENLSLLSQASMIIFFDEIGQLVNVSTNGFLVPALLDAPNIVLKFLNIYSVSVPLGFYWSAKSDTQACTFGSGSKKYSFSLLSTPVIRHEAIFS